MSNKKIYVFFLFLLAVLFYLIKPDRTRLVETFYRSFPVKEFKKKMNMNSSNWMQEQIDKDYKYFSENGITINAIDKTYERISKAASRQKDSFTRYRILKNRLYRYYPKGCELSKREPSFEKAIKTLTKIIRLPDVDFICSDMDGTPEFYMAKDFYIVQDPKNQAPLLSRAKSEDAPFVVLIPDYYSVSTSWEKDCLKMLKEMKNYTWDKKQPLAFWRGGAHDKSYKQEDYQSRPRVRICILSQKYPDLIEAGINVTKDMPFLERLTEDNLIRDHASIEEHLKYKYLPVLDGYMCTYPGYQWRLLSNSVCFKQNSKEVQWFYSALRPYVHYVPIENDMSDLVAKITWAKNHEKECEKIALNATNFILNELMIEDVYLYLYKVIKNYSKLLIMNNKEIIRQTKKDPCWICVQQRKKANKIILKRKNNEI